MTLLVVTSLAAATGPALAATPQADEPAASTTAADLRSGAVAGVRTGSGETTGGGSAPSAIVTGSDRVERNGVDDGSSSTGESTVSCDFDNPEWRDRQEIDGVNIAESKRCAPDNPYAVAASVKGTNNVQMSTLMKSGLARNAVTKTNDRDGDGDPDVVNVTLEITGINERNETDVTEEIAPGMDPSFWTFSPKTRGMVSKDSRAEKMIEMPSVSLRAEEGDTINIHLENTHYLPHTIHLHGTDHPFESDTGGNDGVPQTSEKPLLPGEERVYTLTPRQAGTMFYHCHVVPNVHVSMGLNGLFVIEENEEDNRVQTLNVGAGLVRHSSEWIDHRYSAEYDLIYQSAEKNLHETPKEFDDTRRLAYELNRNHDITDESADYFLLNGKSFPNTLLESVINVKPNRRYRLRMMNSGGETVSIHTHGHKFTVEAYDGVGLSWYQKIKRDVLTITSAQRVDISLNTKNDGLNNYGPGTWIFHDHREQGVTNDGIAPGGTISMITYPEHRDEEGLPITNTNLSRYYDEDFYEGEVPVWGHLDEDLYGDPPGVSIPSDGDDTGSDGSMMMMGMMDMQMMPNGTIVNENTDELPPGCANVSATRNVTVHAGQEYAEAGEAFSYDTHEVETEPCEKLTIEFVNDDEVRHQWMVHGLPMETYPMGMFNVEARRGGTVTATLIAPSEAVTLDFHCSLPQHEQKGMHGELHVGEGGAHEE